MSKGGKMTLFSTYSTCKITSRQIKWDTTWNYPYCTTAGRRVTAERDYH